MFDSTYIETEYHRIKHAVSEQALVLLAQRRGEKFQQFIRPEDDVLEFGVGPGWNLMRVRAHRRVGFDISAAFAGQLQNYGIEFTQSLEALAGQRFDVIIVSHVIEHLENPIAQLSALKPFLKPGGSIVIAIPYEYQHRFRRINSGDTNHHLFSWNGQTLGNLIAAAGFSIKALHLKPSGYERFAAEWAVRLHIGASGYAVLLFLMRLVRPEREIIAIAGE